MNVFLRKPPQAISTRFLCITTFSQYFRREELEYWRLYYKDKMQPLHLHPDKIRHLLDNERNDEFHDNFELDEDANSTPRIDTDHGEADSQ